MRYKGRQYDLAGSPATWFARDDGSEAPPEVALALSRKVARKQRRQLGLRPAGRKRMPPGETVAEKRLAAKEQGGMSTRQIARRHNVDAESVKTDLKRARKRRAKSTKI
jgi:DNA-binding CsgD family transcriptional regulator